MQLLSANKIDGHHVAVGRVVTAVDGAGNTGRQFSLKGKKIRQTMFIRLVVVFTKWQQMKRGCFHYIVYTIIKSNFDAVEKVIKN